MTSFTYCRSYDWANAKTGLSGKDVDVRSEFADYTELIENIPRKHPIFKTFQEALSWISKIMAENEDVIAAEIEERSSSGFAIYFRKTPVGETNLEFRGRIMENKNKKVRTHLFVKVVQ